MYIDIEKHDLAQSIRLTRSFIGSTAESFSKEIDHYANRIDLTPLQDKVLISGYIAMADLLSVIYNWFGILEDLPIDLVHDIYRYCDNRIAQVCLLLDTLECMQEESVVEELAVMHAPKAKEELEHVN